jgi:hypothetical protein
MATEHKEIKTFWVWDTCDVESVLSDYVTHPLEVHGGMTDDFVVFLKEELNGNSSLVDSIYEAIADAIRSWNTNKESND